MARDRPQRAAHAEPSRYLLSIRKAERLFGSAPIWRADATRWRDHREDRRGLPVEPAPDRTPWLAGFPPHPDLGTLSRWVINWRSVFHVHNPPFAKNQIAGPT